MIIYKLTNKLNGKIYIGQTVGTLHRGPARETAGFSHAEG
jgi:hypothetical protein